MYPFVRFQFKDMSNWKPTKWSVVKSVICFCCMLSFLIAATIAGRIHIIATIILIPIGFIIASLYDFLGGFTKFLFIGLSGLYVFQAILEPECCIAAILLSIFTFVVLLLSNVLTASVPVTVVNNSPNNNQSNNQSSPNNNQSTNQGNNQNNRPTP